ncbi:hypothetical protein Trydic_g23611, partial [Trypoxylus dichotomus]
MIRINPTLLPIKAHYFFFMAAMGPILPQLSVYGKEMGISPVVMGSVTGLLPLTFLVAKPIFGIIVDVYRDFRKAIFLSIIIAMCLSYSLLYFIPSRTIYNYDFTAECSQLDTCNVTVWEDRSCDNIKGVTCYCHSDPDNRIHGLVEASIAGNGTKVEDFALCTDKKLRYCNQTCHVNCVENIEIPSTCLYSTPNFWFFIVLLCVGTIFFNVANSLSDAICCDII